MTELPKKSLQELKEETEKALASLGKEGEASGTLNLLDLTPKAAPPKQEISEHKGGSGGTTPKSAPTTSSLSGAALETTPPEKAPKPEEKKAEEEGVLPFASGVVTGFGKGLYNLVRDTKNLLVNTDDASIRQAALSGSPHTSTGISFLSSIAKSGSELGTAFSHIVSSPIDTLSALRKQISSDYSKGSSARKGEMLGEGLAFAATFGIGTNLVRKGFGRLGKTEEVLGSSRVVRESTLLSRDVTLGRQAGLAGETGVVGKLGPGRLMPGTGALSGEFGFLRRVVQPGGLAADVGGGFWNRIEGLFRRGRGHSGTTRSLETTVDGLQSMRAAREVTGAGSATDQVTMFGRAGRQAAEGEMVLGSSMRAGELGQANPLVRLNGVHNVLDELQVASRAVTQPVKLTREVVILSDAGGVVSVSREARVLASEARAVEEAVIGVRTAESTAARQVAMRTLRDSATRYNLALEVCPQTVGRASELKITTQALERFEATLGRTSELASPAKLAGGGSKLAEAEVAFVKLEGRGNVLTSKLDDARACASVSGGSNAVSVEQKALEVERGLAKVKLADTAVVQEQAIADLGSAVSDYNRFIRTNPLTAARATELEIADATLLELKMAAREAQQAKLLANLEFATANLGFRTDALLNDLQRGKEAARGTNAELVVEQQARKVTDSLVEARLARDMATREQALSRLYENVQAYNRIIETQPALVARAAEFKLAEGSLFGVRTAVRDVTAAETLAATGNRFSRYTVAREAEELAIARQLQMSREVAAGAKSQEALAVEQKARQVEEALQEARVARGAGDQAVALSAVRSNVEAYNLAVGTSPMTVGRAEQLAISDAALTRYEVATSNAWQVERTAQAESRLASSHLSRLEGRVELPATGDGLTRVPLSTRADGLVDVANPGHGWFKAGLHRLDVMTDRAWDAFFVNGLGIRGLVSNSTVGARAMMLVGGAVIGRDMYLLSDRVVDRVVRLARESSPTASQPRDGGTRQEPVSTPTGQSRLEKAGLATSASLEARSTADVSRTAQSTPRGQDKTPSTQPERTSLRGQFDGAGRDSDARDSRVDDRSSQGSSSQLPQGASSQVMGRAGYGEPILSPVVHAFHEPANQSTPRLPTTTIAYVEHKEKRRALSVQDWSPLEKHVYLKAGEQAPTEDSPAVPAARPRPRGALGGEPDVPRIVNPTFKPQIIYATQAELFGTTAQRQGKTASSVTLEGAKKGSKGTQG
ncbi:MAG: hypothetical protein HY711_00185, partial [Candidatus Melainabacteria bacterium]|nr:hypothetical protein [Candidatus Melainabacteria bacterium]